MVYSGVGHAPPRNAASLVATGFIVMVEFAHFNRDEEEFPLTEDRLLIDELAGKGGQPDFLRTIAENVLQLLMEADVDGVLDRKSTRLNSSQSCAPGSLYTAL